MAKKAKKVGRKKTAKKRPIEDWELAKPKRAAKKKTAKRPIEDFEL